MSIYLAKKNLHLSVIPAELCQFIPGQLYKWKVPEYLTRMSSNLRRSNLKTGLGRFPKVWIFFLSIFILAAQINVILGRSVPLFGIRRGIWQENRQSLAAIANKREAYQRPSCALWCWGHCSKSLKFRCISIYILIWYSECSRRWLEHSQKTTQFPKNIQQLSCYWFLCRKVGRLEIEFMHCPVVANSLVSFLLQMHWKPFYFC